MSQDKFRKLFLASVLVISIFAPYSRHTMADAGTPSLLISQLKVSTSAQFVTLYNNTDQAIDMATVSLQYFNNYLLVNVTSTKTIQLSGQLAPHGYYIVNDGPITLCYQTIVQSASLSFSSKAGMVQVTKLSQQSNGSVVLATEDFVRWSSAAVSGVQTLPTDPAFLQRQLSNGKPAANGAWQSVKPTSNNPCELVTSVAPSSSVTPKNQLLPALAPPATIVSIAADTTSKIPLVDVGLRAPQLNEILPNPASPQTDDKDEFIEIYNSNSANFDLSGFKLQQASSSASTKHGYTFPDGTIIPARGFAAYPSSNISISLTNSGGMVWLLDPNGVIISQIEAYSTAKDGQAWALADGKWYWTNQPTPGAANVISAATANKSKAGSGVGTVLGASTTKSNSTNSSPQNNDKPRSLNSAILVGVGALAVIYGVYEYRRDLANAIHRLKRDRATRRENRPKD